MTQTIPRYSPRPIEAYGWKDKRAGPAYSEFLSGDAEAWNLAWLSHPYEALPEHTDAQFTVLVRRSVNMILATGEVDIVGSRPASETVRGLLRLAPIRFLRSFDESVAHRTPLYKAYGDRWLETVRARAKLPWAGSYEESLPTLNDARDVLHRVMYGARA